MHIRTNTAHLKMLELVSEFSFEKCQDIVDTMIDFNEALNKWDDVAFWINVDKELKEYTQFIDG